MQEVNTTSCWLIALAADVTARAAWRTVGRVAQRLSSGVSSLSDGVVETSGRKR